MNYWNVYAALNHHAGCSVYDDGACTCGLTARREQASATRGWETADSLHLTVRDHRQKVERLLSLQEELVAALSWYVENDDTNESTDNQSWLEGKARAQAAIAKAKSHEE